MLSVVIRLMGSTRGAKVRLLEVKFGNMYSSSDISYLVYLTI